MEKATVPVETSLEKTYRETLELHGLPLDASLVKTNRHLIPENGIVTISVQEQGYHSVLSLFEGPKDSWPDGIFINDDIMTQGALAALQKLELRAGRDILIATHANRGSNVLMGYEDSLIVIEQDPLDVVQALFDLLEPLLDGRQPEQKHIVLMPQLRHS
jgi:DNA-binding LacI/PurR family transcriptional regulator